LGGPVLSDLSNFQSCPVYIMWKGRSFSKQPSCIFNSWVQTCYSKDVSWVKIRCVDRGVLDISGKLTIPCSSSYQEHHVFLQRIFRLWKKSWSSQKIGSDLWKLLRMLIAFLKSLYKSFGSSSDPLFDPPSLGGIVGLGKLVPPVSHIFRSWHLAGGGNLHVDTQHPSYRKVSLFFLVFFFSY